MENPATWTRAHNTVFRAIRKVYELRNQEIVGASEEAIIVRYLKEDGFLTDAALEVVGFKNPDA